MVRDLLGEPDATEPNPCFPESPRRFWLREWVIQLEGTQRFTDLWKRAESWSAARRKSLTRREKLNKHLLAGAIKINVEKLPPERVRNGAIFEYNHLRWMPDGTYLSPPAKETDNPELLRRVTVDYLRDHRTAYDELWQGLLKLVDIETAHAMLKGRVLREIARV